MQADFSSHQDLPAPLSPGDPNLLSSGFSSAMIDKTDDWGRRRLMAVVSVRSPVSQPGVHANTLLDDISASFFASPFVAVDDALIRAIESSLAAATSRRSGADQDAVVGIAAGALEGDRLLITVRAPCVATVRQDGETYLLPAESAKSEPGRNAATRAESIDFFETDLSNGDHFALIAAMEPFSYQQLRSDAVSADDLEKVVGPRGSYVWMEVADDDPPAAPLDHDEAHPVNPQHRSVHPDLATPLASMWELQAARGPGLFQRPPGADALRRYRSTSRRGMPSSFRSRMPRGVPSIRAMVLALVVISLVISAAVFAAQRRPSTTYPVGASAGQYSAAVFAAIEADDADLVTALMPGAHTLLDNAKNSEADDHQVVALRLQIIAATDYLEGIARLVNPQKLGLLPDALQSQNPRLIEAGGNLYLIAGDIFAFDATSRQLVAVPEFADGDAAGSLANGAGDTSTLAVTSQQTAFFSGDAVGGSERINPHWPVGFGLDDAYSSVFKGRLYLLDRDTADIVVVDPATGDTTEWLSPQSEILPPSPIGMVIDGGIHVLYSGGEIYTLYEGLVSGKSTPSLDPEITQPLAMALGEETGLIYVADLGTPEGRLVVYNRQNDVATTFRLGPDPEGFLDAVVHGSFANLSNLLVSESDDAIYWVADGAIWTAQFPGEHADAGQEN